MNSPQLTHDGDTVTVPGTAYHWRWERDTDTFQITDRRGLPVATGTLAPAVRVATGDGAYIRSGDGPGDVSVHGQRLEVGYPGGSRVALRFEPDAIVVEPVRQSLPEGERVASVHYFADAQAQPTLSHTYLVQPGLSESDALSPILPTEIGLDLMSWLGRCSMGPDSQIYQQWGLPTHYFCGVSRADGHNARGSMTTGLSDAFCCGLTELPAADLFLQLRDGVVSPVFQYRADLWDTLRGPGEVTLGGELVLCFGTDYRAAIRQYYRWVDEHPPHREPPPPARAKAATASQFNTWGAQCADGKEGARFDQQTLESIYDELRASPLRPEMFVIDDKWEGSYGLLEHSTERFPRFEEFLARVRADGQLLGMWAAFLRTNDPASLGLTERHLMRDRTGAPVEKPSRFEQRPYYLLDVSQREVADALSERIAAFVRRYDPDLVKFDFGYELPSLSVAVPADPAYAGERLLARAVDVVASALHAVKPDIALMYYSLSPLIHADQHCHDDMYLCVGDYAAEGNRRLFFSSLLGELGMPTYGSGGYDWRSMPGIWFDTAVAGPVGSLNSFGGDETDDRLTPELAALYQGLTAISRRTTVFRVEPVTPVSVRSSGARSSSWLRYERDEPVLACLRAADCGAAPVRETGVRTDSQVVVSALTDEPLRTASRIGVVPFGPGTVSLPDAGPARVVRHLLDGSRGTGTAERRDGELHVRLDDDADPAPVAWLEIDR